MRLSLNEIEVTARKAALGAGLPLGLAEEAGAASGWLAAAGFPVAVLVAAALAGAGKACLRLHRSGGIWRLEGDAGPLPALIAAPSACDLVIAAAREGEPAALRAIVDVPALALAHCAVAAERSGVPLAVRIEDEVWLAGREGRPAGANEIERLSTWRSREALVALPGSAQGWSFSALAVALERGVEVEPAEWERVQALADRMLVPATPHSHERGAGAGLIDSD